MSNEQIAHHAIQLLFQHHGLVLGPSLDFEEWLKEEHIKGWQEIVFQIDSEAPILSFKGVRSLLGKHGAKGCTLWFRL